MTARFCGTARRIGAAVLGNLPGVLACAGAALPSFVSWLRGCP